MRQAFAPVGTRLRRVAATEDGGESVFERPGNAKVSTSRPLTGAMLDPGPFLDLTQPRR